MLNAYIDKYKKMRSLIDPADDNKKPGSTGDEDKKGKGSRIRKSKRSKTTENKTDIQNETMLITQTNLVSEP